MWDRRSLPNGGLVNLRILLDRNDLGGAAGERLEGQRATAGEQVQAARAHDHRLQPVEQRLANAIRRRAQAGLVGHRNASATPASADDA